MEQYAVIWVNGDKALKERKDVNFLRQFEFSAEAMRRAEDSKERQRKFDVRRLCSAAGLIWQHFLSSGIQSRQRSRVSECHGPGKSASTKQSRDPFCTRSSAKICFMSLCQGCSGFGVGQLRA